MLLLPMFLLLLPLLPRLSPDKNVSENVSLRCVVCCVSYDEAVALIASRQAGGRAGKRVGVKPGVGIPSGCHVNSGEGTGAASATSTVRRASRWRQRSVASRAGVGGELATTTAPPANNAAKNKKKGELASQQSANEAEMKELPTRAEPSRCGARRDQASEASHPARAGSVSERDCWPGRDGDCANCHR